MSFGPIDIDEPLFQILAILALYAAFAGLAVVALVCSGPLLALAAFLRRGFRRAIPPGHC